MQLGADTYFTHLSDMSREGSGRIEQLLQSRGYVGDRGDDGGGGFSGDLNKSY